MVREKGRRKMSETYENVDCDECDGSGRQSHGVCRECNGLGYTVHRRY